MELTTGWILVFIGIVGIVGCTAALIICGNVIKRQREHMLERIETE